MTQYSLRSPPLLMPAASPSASRLSAPARCLASKESWARLRVVIARVYSRMVGENNLIFRLMAVKLHRNAGGWPKKP